MYRVTFTSDEAVGRQIEEVENDPMDLVRLMMEIEMEPTLHEGTLYGSAEEIARLDELMETYATGPHLYRDRWRVERV
jgi:hypothetical protein